MRHDSRMVMLISILFWLAPPGSAFSVGPVALTGAQVGGRWAAAVEWQPLPEVGLRF